LQGGVIHAFYLASKKRCFENMKRKVFEYIIHHSKILIADADEGARQTLRSFCRDTGFDQIAEIANGKEALQKINDWRPDLVFLDLQIPLLDGLQICHELKRHALLDSMVIIMQTDIDDPDFKSRAFAAGVTDLIIKPLCSTETMARATAHLERHYFKSQMEADYRRIQSELEEAVILQNILLPREELLETLRKELSVDIAHYYHPASELAGDYLSVQKLDNGRIALISVDVSGHGLTAALYAFSIHTLLEEGKLSNNSPAQTLKLLNEKLHSFMSTGKFATMFLAIIDTVNHQIHYSAAASPSPVLISSGALSFLHTKAHPLGIDHQSSYEDHVVPYQKGDVLFIFSDALLETPNPDGKRMQQAEISSKVLYHQSRGAADILREIVTSFYTQYSQQPTDDLSMLVCKL
jgi:phosphoserine phosphatase RsbU/P